MFDLLLIMQQMIYIVDLIVCSIYIYMYVMYNRGFQ